jgi:sugar-phosphatase
MQAVIFDMDGVLVDSEPLWRLGERQTFAEIGLELTDADCETTMGMRTDEVIEHWFSRDPWEGPTVEEVENRLEARMQELIAEKAIAMPGVERSIAMIRANGLALGLATSSAPTLIDEVLSKLGLVDVFDVTHSAVTETLGKPHPAVFLSAARLLGVVPSQCIAIEDSVAGVQSAKTAGMRVIAVPPPHLFDESGYDQADIKLRSLEDLTEEMLR